MTSEHNYGIKSLTTSAADGGTITTSGNYRIHTFTSTGTFTVNKPMNVEVLVVAGGGGGGVAGGGGGAGGLLYNNAFSVGTGANTVTIGSGGVGAVYGSNYESSLSEASTTILVPTILKTITATGERNQILYDSVDLGGYGGGVISYSINDAANSVSSTWVYNPPTTYTTYTKNTQPIHSGDVVRLWGGTAGLAGTIYVKNVYLRIATITGSNGQNSVFSTMTTVGGGHGASLGVAATSGGSGGGGSYGGRGDGYTSFAPGSGTSLQGNNGGTASASTPFPTGGGGGAGAVGANYSGSQSGAGGAGLSSSITGSVVNYAGGGGGSYSTQGALAGAGGTGGGGAGGASSGAAGGNGIANTGGGGGSGVINANGGNGGSGIVIIRYLSSYDVTATNMTISTNDSPCRTGICTATVDVTWTNNASSASVTNLSITVSNGTSTISSSYPSVSFAANETKGPYTFIVSNMTVGTHSICPNPN